MYSNIGSRIREVRVSQGIGLNAFAKKLNVSSGYLSELETGKSDTIKLSLLDKIQDELSILPRDGDTVFSQRISQIEQQLVKLADTDPLYAEFLLSNMESSIVWFLKSANNK